MIHWASNYIGIPYQIGGRDREGLDCWGLIRLIYKEVNGIILPNCPGIVKGDLRGDAAEIAREAHERWKEMPGPVESCVVAMSQKTVLHHVGLWTFADGGKIVHCRENCSVVAETVRTLRLRGVRIFKYFQYGIHN